MNTGKELEYICCWTTDVHRLSTDGWWHGWGRRLVRATGVGENRNRNLNRGRGTDFGYWRRRDHRKRLAHTLDPRTGKRGSLGAHRDCGLRQPRIFRSGCVHTVKARASVSAKLGEDGVLEGVGYVQ